MIKIKMKIKRALLARVRVVYFKQNERCDPSVAVILKTVHFARDGSRYETF